MTDNKSNIGIDQLYNRSLGVPDHSTTQVLTVSGTSARSTVLKGNAHYLVSTSTTLHYRFDGAADDATSADHIMFAGTESIYHTGKGTTWYLSVIQDSSGGYCYVTELLGDRLG